MARMIKVDRQSPYKVESEGGKAHYICGCGLTANKPFCDGTHNRCQSEEADALYVYDKEGRIQVN